MFAWKMPRGPSVAGTAPTPERRNRRRNPAKPVQNRL